jgi:hypothetical protein
MEFIEGQIYTGTITFSGGDDGPIRNWIVVSPFNKTHIHSIDDPLDLHCWPLFSAEKGLEGGYLKLVKTDPQHPVVQLQRTKEKLSISDVHMGLQGESLDKMLELLEQAVTTCESYAAYAAGEILAFMDRAYHNKQEAEIIRQRVHEHLQAMEH